MSETTNTTTRRTDATTTNSRAEQGRQDPRGAGAEVAALAKQLNDAVAELTTSEAWVAMLRVAARFTRYSPQNALLLWMQADSAASPCPGLLATGRGRPWAGRSSRVRGRWRW